jgi:hypothetical protein
MVSDAVLAELIAALSSVATVAISTRNNRKTPPPPEDDQ